MFNETLKSKYLSTLPEAMRERVLYIFKKTQGYEESWQLDICQQNDVQKLEECLSILFGGKPKTIEMTNAMIGGYIRWCHNNNVPHSMADMPDIIISPKYRIKNTMVANPLHLKNYIDILYPPEKQNGSDNIYRGYLWLAYIGVEEGDIFNITNSDVDFDTMCIYLGDKAFTIYNESLLTFKNLVSLDEFEQHSGIKSGFVRKRVSGNQIMRGARGLGSVATVRNMVSKRINEIKNSEITNLCVSYSTLHLSGLFYRINEMERAGIEPVFAEEVDRIMSGKTYSPTSRRTLAYRHNMIEKDLMTEYAEWKKVFIV